jgi:hypothetical protein
VTSLLVLTKSEVSSHRLKSLHSRQTQLGDAKQEGTGRKERLVGDRQAFEADFRSATRVKRLENLMFSRDKNLGVSGRKEQNQEEATVVSGQQE